MRRHRHARRLLRILSAVVRLGHRTAGAVGGEVLRESAVPVQRQRRATAGWTDLTTAWAPALPWDITIRSVTSRSRAIAFLLGAVAEQAVRLFTVMLRQSLDLRELQTQTTDVTVGQGGRPPVTDAPGTDRRPEGFCHCIRCNASGLMRGGALSGCCPRPDRGPLYSGATHVESCTESIDRSAQGQEG